MNDSSFVWTAGSPSLVIDVILATSVHDKLKKDLSYKELIIGIVRSVPFPS
jgi:hypothetical protein